MALVYRYLSFILKRRVGVGRLPGGSWPRYAATPETSAVRLPGFDVWRARALVPSTHGYLLPPLLLPSSYFLLLFIFLFPLVSHARVRLNVRYRGRSIFHNSRPLSLGYFFRNPVDCNSVTFRSFRILSRPLSSRTLSFHFLFFSTQFIDLFASKVRFKKISYCYETFLAHDDPRFLFF